MLQVLALRWRLLATQCLQDPNTAKSLTLFNDLQEIHKPTHNHVLVPPGLGISSCVKVRIQTTHTVRENQK